MDWSNASAIAGWVVSSLLAALGLMWKKNETLNKAIVEDLKKQVLTLQALQEENRKELAQKNEETQAILLELARSKSGRPAN